MTTRTESIIKVYIDTNVLVNYITGQASDVASLNYVFKKRRKETLFTSSLALVQTITQLQKGNKKNGRKPYDYVKTGRAISELKKRITVLDLTEADIDDGMKESNKDLEDSIHYVLCQKVGCEAIMTNNVSDFSCFTKIRKLDPRYFGTIKQRIK
ncbi:MAG: PIN domain-containing protein [Bacteroidales bacterium]|nr:PIN domain-containing protein [Bacteroidales bacterium]